MKKLSLLFCASLFIVSCSSIQRVSEKTFLCEADSIFGSCEDKIKSSCPNGHKIESQDSKYGFGGMKDKVYFSCLDS